MVSSWQDLRGAVFLYTLTQLCFVKDLCYDDSSGRNEDKLEMSRIVMGTAYKVIQI